MSDSSGLIFEVSDADFADAVVARSAETPVLVDFWAPWCGPCRALAPVLEAMVREWDGGVLLAKMNSDDNPDTPARFGVRGIPNVQLFVGGRAVDQFVGALPEDAVRAFLRKNLPSEADRLVAEARGARERGDDDSAAVALRRAIELEPSQAAAHLELARLALAAGDVAAARDHAGRVPASADEYDDARAVGQAAVIAADAIEIGSREACERRVAADQDDLEARYALAGHAVAEGRYRDALDAYLAIATADRDWRDQAARRAMLAVFGLVGARSELANTYRRKLMLVT